VAGNQVDNIQILDASAPFLPRTIEAADNLQISARMELQNDVLITANLTVRGAMVTEQAETVSFDDNHLYLNSGYETVAAQTGGLVVNYLPTSTNDTVAAGGFTAGVPATSNPTVVTTGTATFAAGDLIQITGAADPQNNGLFEVLSHVGTTLTIRGIGTTATDEDFTQNQFDTDNTAQGTIRKVNVSVMRAGADGAWETAFGSSTPLSFSDISASAVTLQTAYENGNTITTSAAEGDVVISGTEQLLITATGGIDIDTQLDFDGTVFDVQMSGTNGFSIDGTAASNVSVDAGNLTLSTTTSGNVVLNATGDIDADAANILFDATASISLDAITSSNFTVTGNDAGTINLTLAATNAGAGAGNVLLSADDEIDLTAGGLVDINAGANLDVDVTGTVDILATGAFSIDGTGASNVTAASGNLTLNTTTSGDVVIDAAVNVDVDGTAVTVDATTSISLDAVTSSNLTVTGNSAGAENLTLSATNAGAGTGNVLVSSDDEIDLTAGGLIDINAGANLDIDVTGTFDMLATGAFSIDGTGASNVTADAGNLALSTTTSGSLLLSSADDSTYTIPNASATALTVTDGADDFLVLDSTAGLEKVDLPQFSNIAGGAGLIFTTNDTLTAGDVVQIESDGDVGLADADTGTLSDGLVTGVTRAAATAGNPAQIYTAPGSLVPIRFVSAPASAFNGLPCYLSTTAGQVDTSIPAGANNRVVFQVGIVQGADGVATTVDVLYMPMFISRGPGVS
jgi:hypothetical protein